MLLPRSIALLLIVAAAATGCSSDGTDDGGLPPFPKEKSARDFPGMSYPAHEGALPRPSAPVWLIGIDGATWEQLRPAVARGDLPSFAALLESGAHGELRSEEPTISPALWASVATGVPRFEHGVVDFLVKLPVSYETAESGPLDRRAPAIWEYVGAVGGRSAVLSWFGSFPAEATPGVYVAKGFDPSAPRDHQVEPSGFAARLAAEAPGPPPAEWVEAIARNESFRRSLAGDWNTLAALETVAAEVQPDLLVAYFSGIDVVQHVAWRHMDPSTQAFPQDGEPDPELAGVIPAYYRFIDAALGRVLELVPDDATLIVVSDHGAGPMRVAEAFHLQLDVLLTGLGLMQETNGELFTISQLYRHDKRIWLNLAGVEPAGVVNPDEAQAVAERMADRLKGLRTDAGLPVFESIVDHTRDESWRPGDPALTVRFAPAALTANSVTDGSRTLDFAPVRLRHTDVSGSHRLGGIVLLRGPGIAPGPLPAPANLYQVAPTVLYRLGLPQDATMLAHAPADGGVIDAAVNPARPVRMAASYPGVDRAALVRSRDGSGAVPDPTLQDNLEKLRSLGYIR